MPLAVAGALVGFCAIAVFVALQVDDWRQFGLTRLDQPVRPVASTSSPAEAARLSQTESEASTAVLEGAIEPQAVAGAPAKQSTIALAANVDAQREAAERTRLEAEAAERKQLAAQRAAEEKARQEAAERQRREAEEAEQKRLAAQRAAEEKARRQRVAALHQAQQKAEQERAERARQSAEREALKKTLAEIGVSDPKQIEDLATAAQDQLRSESVLTARLNAILAEVKAARERSNAGATAPKDLPLSWTIEEKARLKLEQLLGEINDEKQVAAAPKLRAGPTLVRNQVTLKLKDSNLRLTGELKSHTELEFVIELPSKERMTLPTEHFDCFGSGCPNSAGRSQSVRDKAASQ